MPSRRLTLLHVWQLLAAAVFGLVFTAIELDIWLGAWMCLGLVAGWAILLLDEFWLIKWYQAEEQTYYLLTRSLLFLGVLAALAVFVVTSSGSVLGQGIVMGMVISLASDICVLRSKPAEFDALFLSQVKTEITDTLRQRLLLGWVGLTVLLSVFVLA